MKGIQEFLKDLKTNEELAKKFKGVEEAEAIVKLAKENGYEFTEDDYMDLQMDSVSGGSLGSVVSGICNFLGENLNVNGSAKLGDQVVVNSDGNYALNMQSKGNMSGIGRKRRR